MKPYEEMTKQEIRAAAEKVAAALEGTCMESVDGQLEHQGFPAELSLDQTFCDAIDQLVFSCDGCGWWCSMDECNNDEEFEGDELCGRCAEEDDRRSDD